MTDLTVPMYTPVLPGNIFAEQKSKQLFDATAKAYADGDAKLGDHLTELQRQQSIISEVFVKGSGGDPMKEVAPEAAWTDPSIEADRQVRLYFEREGRILQTLQVHDFRSMQDYINLSVLPRYVERNESRFVERKDDMSPEELMAYHQQLEPLTEDFATLREWQGRVDALDQAFKLIDPNLSVYTYEKTKNIAGWIGRESSAAQMGYMQAGYVADMPSGVLETAGEYAFTLVEPLADLAGMLVFGLGPALDAVSGGRIGWEEPTNYIMSPEGKILTNAGKVPGGVELGALIWNMFVEEDLKTTIARANAYKAYVEHNQSLFKSVTKGVAWGIGALAGFGGIFGVAIKAGRGIGGATSIAATKGLGKLGMTASDKSKRLINLLGRSGGMLSASAMTDAVMFGRAESYQKALLHGALLVPVMIGVSRAGRVMEQAIGKTIPKIPSKFALGISGALEGGLFHAIEDLQGHAIWGLINDPSKSTLQRYFETMASFGIFKGVTGRGLLALQAERRQILNEAAMGRMAERVAREGVEQPLGEARQRRKAAPTRKKEVQARVEEQEIILEARREGQKFERERIYREALEAEIGPEEPPFGPVRPEPEFKPPDVFGPPKPKRFVPGTEMPEASLLRLKEGVPGAKRIRESDIVNIARGQIGGPGIRIPFFSQTIPGLGSRRGTAINVPIRSGLISSQRTSGLYNFYTNAVRIKTDLNIPTIAHEWAHAMQRQAFFKVGEAGFVRAADAWVREQSPEMRRDMWNILEGYGGRENLKPWQMAAESWAEWFGRDLLGDTTIDAEAPVFSKMARDWLGHPDQAFLRDSSYVPLKSAMQQYMEQGWRQIVEEEHWMGREGAREKVGKPAGRIVEWVETQWDKLSNAFIDDVAFLKREEKRAFFAAGIDIEQLSVFEHPSRILDITRNMGVAQTMNFVMDGVYDMNMRKLPGTEGLRQIMEAVAAVGNVQQFGILLSSIRKAQSIKRGIPMGKPLEVYARAILEILRENPGFNVLRKRLKIWTDGVIDLVGELGNLSLIDVELMKRVGVVYVPLTAILEGPVKHAPGRGIAERGTGTKALRGHVQETRDPLAQMVPVVQTMLVKAYQNLVLKAVYKAHLLGNMGRLVTLPDRSAVGQAYRIDEIFRAIRKDVQKQMDKREAAGEKFDRAAEMDEQFGILGALMREGEVSDALITMFAQKTLPFGEHKGLIAYTPHFSPREIDQYSGWARAQILKHNDKILWLEVADGVYRNLMKSQMQWGPATWDSRILRDFFTAPARWQRNLAVRWNPAFTLTNALRDIPSYAVFNPEARGFLQPADAMKGYLYWSQGIARLMQKSDGRDRMRDLFEASGVGMNMFWNEGVMKDMLGDPRYAIGRAHGWLTKQSERWSNFLSTGEGALRLKSMDIACARARAEKLSPTEATFRAVEAGQEWIINFARGGTVMKVMTQMQPFLTATMNGLRRTMLALAGDTPTPRIRRDGTIDTRPIAERKAEAQRAAWMNGLALFTIPQLVTFLINHEEDWYRDMPEWKKLSRLYFAENAYLPLPYEIGVVFSGFLQAGMDMATDSNPAGKGEMFKEAFFPYIKEIESYFPVMIRPILEVRYDRNFYFESEITPRRLQNKPALEQVTRNTTASAQWVFKNFRPLVEFIGISNAIQLEQFLNGYTAGKGTLGLRSVDAMLGFQNNQDLSEAMLSRWYTPPHKAGRIVSQMYDLSSQLTEVAEKTPEQFALVRQLDEAKRYFAELRRAEERGERTLDEINRIMFEIADEIMERNR